MGFFVVPKNEVSSLYIICIYIYIIYNVVYMMNSMNSNGTGGTGTPFSCEYCEKSVDFRVAQCLDRVFFSEKMMILISTYDP